MVDVVKDMIWRGEDVRIFTARCAAPNDFFDATTPMTQWCEKHIGEILPVTCTKNMYCRRIYDDIAIQVKRNQGVIVNG